MGEVRGCTEDRSAWVPRRAPQCGVRCVGRNQRHIGALGRSRARAGAAGSERRALHGRASGCARRWDRLWRDQARPTWQARRSRVGLRAGWDPGPPRRVSSPGVPKRDRTRPLQAGGARPAEGGSGASWAGRAWGEAGSGRAWPGELDATSERVGGGPSWSPEAAELRVRGRPSWGGGGLGAGRGGGGPSWGRGGLGAGEVGRAWRGARRASAGRAELSRESAPSELPRVVWEGRPRASWGGRPPSVRGGERRHFHVKVRPSELPGVVWEGRPRASRGAPSQRPARGQPWWSTTVRVPSGSVSASGTVISRM